MLRSLTSAVSGLKNFTIMLDVLGNNLANIRTLGYKGSRVSFAETRSQSLTGVSRGFGGGFGNQKQIGLGVGISATDLDLTQGSLEFTGTPTDMSIEGNSFFVLSDGEKNRYARAGNFFFNNQGILVNPNGLAVQGWRADDDGVINVFSPMQEIFLDTNLSSPASATETVFLSGNLDASRLPEANVWTSGIPLTVGNVLAVGTDDLATLDQSSGLAPGDTIEITGNLPDGTALPVPTTFTYAAGDDINDLLAAIDTAYGGQATASIANGKIVLTDVLDSNGKIVGTSLEAGESATRIALSSSEIALPTFENSVEGYTGTVTTSTAIFDSLGASHNMLLTFTKTNVDGEWRWKAEFVGGDESIVSGDTGTINFSTSGEVVSFDVDGTATGITVNPGTGASQFTLQLDVQGGLGFSGVTQFTSDPSLIVREQDGKPTGVLLRFAIDTQGIITGIFSNDENITLAQVALAEFPNPLGLLRAGDGIYDLASSTGTPIIGAAGDQFNASILSGSLEMSNVDLVRQFTDMITTQRGFQASARVVTTADQVLEETMRLKR
ncbi:MAG: flagellar hook-basal body complex protein [Fidelibacterota bacterium]|nr:MAG: flagellar hook-basal body complex protein [Candidatus Neomarinimicrobiota bacterium]